MKVCLQGFCKLSSIPVSYIADDQGYRVTSMESEPIGNGPIANRESGKAVVQQLVSGVETQYAIQAKVRSSAMIY